MLPILGAERVQLLRTPPKAEAILNSRFLRANRDTDEALGPFVDTGRREATTEALARIAFTESIGGDDFLIYMARFFRGRIYDRLERRAEAEMAYSSALEVYPRAQSARLALAALLHVRGDELTARDLSEDALHAPEGTDPWRVYHLGDYRRLPACIEQMRAAVQGEQGRQGPLPR
jgi:tetratricopeptide (TPR) repeat protein